MVNRRSQIVGALLFLASVGGRREVSACAVNWRQRIHSTATKIEYRVHGLKNLIRRAFVSAVAASSSELEHKIQSSTKSKSTIASFIRVDAC
jgi:hypothetical protein